MCGAGALSWGTLILLVMVGEEVGRLVRRPGPAMSHAISGPESLRRVRATARPQQRACERRLGFSGGLTCGPRAPRPAQCSVAFLS